MPYRRSLIGRHFRRRGAVLRRFRNLMNLVPANEDGGTRKSDMIEQMIGEIQKRPAIWDKTQAGYNNPVVVQSFWNELSHIFCLPDAVLLQKWNILVGCFKNYHSICAVKNSDYDNDQRCAGLPPWSYLNNMWFLNKSGNFNIPRSPKKSSKSVKKTDNTQKLSTTNTLYNSHPQPSGSRNTEISPNCIIKLEPTDDYLNGDTNLTEENRCSTPEAIHSQMADQHYNQFPQFHNICDKLRSLATDLTDIENNLRSSELSPNAIFANSVTSLLDKMEPEKQMKCQILIFEILHSVLQE